MVVDDEEQHRGLVTKVLEREGYEVVACSSGEQALERLAERDVDLVLIDYVMPGMKGDEVLGLMRESRRTRDVPVIMVTALQESDHQVWALELGANDFITKPFVNEVLLARVRSLVKVKRLNDATERFEDVLGSLCAAVEAKDHYTQGHSDRASLYASWIATQMGLDEHTVELVQQAGLVHDIGKLVIELSFINKPGKLTDEEWAVMKTHPEAGARIIAPLTRARPMLPLIRYHHERLNGRGYPDGLVEDQIPLPVRILSVADVYDALTTKRSYRDSMSHDKAMRILEKEVGDGSWDGKVVEAMGSIDRD
jgi:putative two-component system response regulator